MHKTLTALAVATTMALTACGGGGDDNDSSDATDNRIVSRDEIVADLTSANINFLSGSRPAGTWRWLNTPAEHVRVVIPAPAAGHTTEQDYAAKARVSIATINTKLAGLLVLEETSTAPATGPYVQISYGTSYVPPGSTAYSSYCANVSTGPNLGNVIQPDGQNGIATHPVYINLGNGHCDVTQDIVTHEFGHALGLVSHFSGFGDDGPVSAFWDVLATLYGNPVSTTAANLVVKRITN